ncbi:alpha/beta fold hydrolase [Actinoplanes rectilineatus]|uniref:alpha/beta fold hydrolase n=1 Tax=Actinoplanes rectilineatus TaxID=113571 RepID=UPI0005F2C062|nr:alpha/beta fold hydrolase [Actinoplanes rectilineatus]
MTAYITDGSGPPIVLISQLDSSADIWAPLLPHLDGLRTVTYDRPGTGSAPPRPAPNPPIPHSGFARELAGLLRWHDVREPAILVGHSFGALIARAYAATWPDRVAGLVIVDGAIPQFHLMPSAEKKIDGGTEIDVVAGQAEILAAPTPTVPAAVVVRTHGRWDGLVQPPHPAVEDVWLTSQRLLARDWNCPLIIADNSGHQLQREAPSLVTYAIRTVRDAVVSGEPVKTDPQAAEAAGGHLDS